MLSLLFRKVGLLTVPRTGSMNWATAGSAADAISAPAPALRSSPPMSLQGGLVGDMWGVGCVLRPPGDGSLAGGTESILAVLAWFIS